MEYLPETSFPVINAYFKIGELSDIEVSGLEKMKNYATAASLLKGIEPIGYFRTECFYGVTRNGLRAVKNTEDEEKFKEYWEKAFPDGFRMTDDFPSDPASKKNDFIWNPLLKNLKENEYPEISSNLGL